jgi:hypothetical protein
MRIPKVPSLLHFARFISKEPKAIDFRLREMAERPPHVNYVPARKGARDHLVLGVDAQNILGMVERIKGKAQRQINKSAREAFLVLAPSLSGRRFADIDVRYFPIGRKLHVPVNPFLYSSGLDVESILWPSFWSELKLQQDQLAVYATILDATFLSSVDFQHCSLELADLGRVPGEKQRSPHILRRADLPTLTISELKEFTDPFAEAFLKIVEEIRRDSDSTKDRPGRSDAPRDWYLDQSPPPR